MNLIFKFSFLISSSNAAELNFGPIGQNAMRILARRRIRNVERQVNLTDMQTMMMMIMLKIMMMITRVRRNMEARKAKGTNQNGMIIMTRNIWKIQETFR